MNRADVRKARAAGCPDRILARAVSYECPDCNAETTLTLDKTTERRRTWRLGVTHSSTCSWLASRTNATAGVASCS